MRTSPSCTHQLTTLLEADCWTMFRKRAFSNREPRETPTLLDIGRRMVEKCKGVPLAINSLGGLLYSKQDEQEWEFIEKSEIWSSLENENGILPILRLSFDHLPSPSLKQSFAYCSIFSKDEVIIKDELIQRWMGLGYLQPSSRCKVEMEELGNEYFNTLLRNSLFQEVEYDEYNNITSCKMHDLKSGHRIEELGNLTKLRGRLVVRDLQNVKDKEEAEKAKMFQKSKLQELTLYWDGDLRNSNDNHEDVLEGLKPHRKVKGLILCYFGGRRLASWMSTTDALLLLNLVKIELKDFRLCEQVPVLGHLPHLATVKMVRLHNLKRIGPEFYGPDEGIIDNCSTSGAAARVFPALREFQLFDMPQLEEWSDVSSLPVVGTRMLEFFPLLQKLDISKCPKLITIPGDLLCI
ncbi:putative disease resistance RPP13-like protein 1 [Rhododendron vialii]|uniref:putative disease resistance RPP13-like protein 1 n=1 Tax=Rhododendron vialii TaxID=182163 RepID=UPI002660151E|nr:putative disease resistance RPP13-like protein 1 [Rhododendron vialii]